MPSIGGKNGLAPVASKSLSYLKVIPEESITFFVSGLIPVTFVLKTFFILFSS
jgi:hypothetical protein